MKIAYILSAALLIGAGTASAQSKIDARGRQLLDLYKAGTLSVKDADGFLAVPASRGSEALVNVLVETSDSAVLDSLESCGYDIEYISPSFSIVTMPVDGIDVLAQSPAVATLSFGGKAEPVMDKARGASRVNTIHTGLGISYQGVSRHPFKGKGVIVGMFDLGLDPSHINFMSDDQSECRLKYYARFSGTSTTPTVYTGDQVRTAPTDNVNECHGTHVAGIMGGAYNGAGNYLQPAAVGTTDRGSIPLYGVAPEADLALCAGPLYNNNILAGIRRLINYATSEDKPMVVNLSLGGNDGPHDGTDAFSRALDELAKETIICVAAGNEGSDYIHAGKTFTAADKQLKVLMRDNRFPSGYMDVWSSTSAPITVSVIVVNAAGEITAKISGQEGKTVTCGTGDGADHSIFRNAFDGSIVITSVAGSNGRYNVSLTANSDVSLKAGNNVRLGIMIEGNEGVRVDAYGNGNRGIGFATSATQGFDRGDNDGSINSMGCGFNTIIVGSYGTRASLLNLDGNSFSTGGGEGNLANYSSWGNLVDGRKMPHLCAPGTGIYSSYSGPYVNSTKDFTSIVARATEGETTHYWGCMSGTSMATPYVTGTVALWLEADPTLTAARAREIMIETASVDDYVGTEVAWGAGKLQATNGIKRVISSMGAVEGVDVEGSEIFISSNGLGINVFASGANEVEAQLYTPSGVLAAASAAKGENLAVLAPSAGMYILAVKAGANSKTLKIVVR